MTSLLIEDGAITRSHERLPRHQPRLTKRAQEGLLVYHLLLSFVAVNKEMRALSLVTLFCSTVVVSAAKKSRNVPHGHHGVLPAHQPGPFGVKLSSSDLASLDKGNAVMKQTMPKEGEDSGTSLCVQDVEAPAGAVWNQILSLDEYKGKVPKVNACQNYQVSKNGDNTYTVKTKMVIGVMPGYAVRIIVASSFLFLSIFSSHRFSSTRITTTTKCVPKITLLYGPLITTKLATLTMLPVTGT